MLTLGLLSAVIVRISTASFVYLFLLFALAHLSLKPPSHLGQGYAYAALLLAGEGGAGTRAWARWRSKHSDAVAAPAVECADGEGVKCE